MTNADRRIVTIATGQLGSFSRAQAHDAGLSDRQLRSRVQSGFLLQSGPNSFRLPGAAPSLESQLSELVLDIGEPVWVAGPSAAALLGFDGYVLRRPFHLMVPRERSLHRQQTVLHRATVLDPIDRTHVGGMPVTSAVRTLIDLARVESSEALTRAVDSALRDGRVSEDLLHRRLVALRSQGRYGLPLLHEVLAGREVTWGGQSWLEREFLRILGEACLPRPETQSVVSKAQDRLVRVDCRFPGTLVVVELLGYRWHRSPAQMGRDAARYNALLAAGFLPYQFTYAQVVSSPAEVVATTRQALHRSVA